MIKYKKLFGIIRIFLGMLFLIYPAFEFFQQGGMQSEESMRWLFVFIFFLVYSFSAVRNGIREVGGQNPAFNFIRFFEASMNGFISVYIIIILIASRLNSYAKFMLFILIILTLFSMIRDIRYISLQYYEKKQRTRK